MIEELCSYFHALQTKIVETVEQHDTVRFSNHTKSKTHHQSRIAIIEGTTIEKGAVNVSLINGLKLPEAASKRHPECIGYPFKVTGISVILHPHNPHVPTMHANLRAFNGGPNNMTHWIGGGMDLTPSYGYEHDAVYWHETIARCLEPFGKQLYTIFKQQCDDYFYLPHRREWRGIGGIFFDDLSWEKQRSIQFIKALGECIIKAYIPIMLKRKNMPYTEYQRDFQQFRRGRYVEFNLIYDRGTKFGLEFGSDPDQILVSLPKYASWSYDFPIEPNSKEADLSTFLKPKSWVQNSQFTPEQQP